MRGRWIGCLVVVLLLAGGRSASGETSSWQSVVEQFADALLQREMRFAQPLLASHVVVREMEREGPNELRPLFDRVVASKLIAVHTYSELPLALASDLSRDIGSSSLVPDEVKQWMVPQDDASILRANAIAAQWVNLMLEPNEQEPVGVILLWTPRLTWKGFTADATPVYQPLFVLLKGELRPDGSYRVRRIVHGNPIPPPRG